MTETAALLHGQEKRVFADAGYTGAEKRPEVAVRVYPTSENRRLALVTCDAPS